MSTRVPKTPTAFTNNAASIIGSSEPSCRRRRRRTGWTGKASSARIGELCFGVKAAAALPHVAGCTIINDVSARN
jgi:2-keto-4-pentenoate hydratase/2-oxohepta-3-ene-1,7-dioic acid hydratase in catechol pathway